MHRLEKPMSERGTFVIKVAVSCAMIATFCTASVSLAAAAASTHIPKSVDIAPPPIGPATDFHSKELSPDAIDLAQHLKLTASLTRLADLRRQEAGLNGRKPSLELREDIRDAKEEIVETIEQTRLDIDAVQAEISQDVTAYGELYQAYSEARDNRVNKTNIWSFRTNGALWAVAEALTIPTYSRPRYSISSGTVGILAGLVPSAFSACAVRESGGGHYCRLPRPNLLSKVLGYQTTVRTDFPDSVWDFLNSPAPGDTGGKNRIDRLIERWLADQHLRLFTDRKSTHQLDLLTGAVQHNITIELLGERITMLNQLSTMMHQMNRPLAELMMFVRNNKELPDRG
jgi:hypothetical protein